MKKKQLRLGSSLLPVTWTVELRFICRSAFQTHALSKPVHYSNSFIFTMQIGRMSLGTLICTAWLCVAEMVVVWEFPSLYLPLLSPISTSSSLYILFYSILLNYIILYHIILNYIILYYIILYYIILNYTVLCVIWYYTILHYVSYYIILYCVILYYIILYCIVLYYITSM